MLKTALIAAGALAAAATLSLPTHAHATGTSFGFAISGPHGSVHFGTPGYYHGPSHGSWRHRQVLPPRAVTHRLHRQGFRRVASLQRRGHVYLARAQQRRGQWVHLSVNAYTGQVISVRRIW